MQNKLFLISLGLLSVFALYKLLFRKDSVAESLDKEYKEILSSDKYKVKGQYD